jgi:hypothetical protein
MLAYAKMCRQNLEWLENEKRRVKGALERAEVAALDRKVEASDLQIDLAKMFSDLG